jgi:hypothetical protein
VFDAIELKCYFIGDIPTDYNPMDYNPIVIAGKSISLVTKSAGYGSRHFFICPRCGEHRAKLYTYENCVVFCRSCLPLDLYRYRRNMYDEGGTRLISWHLRKLMKTVGVKDIRLPFCYLDYIDARPRYMRHEKFEKIIKKAQMLENMRWCALLVKQRFTAADIKEYTSDEYLDQHDIHEIYTLLLFCNHNDWENYIDRLHRTNEWGLRCLKKAGL